MLYAPMVMLSKVMPCQCIVGKLWNAFASSGPVAIQIDSSALGCSMDGCLVDCSRRHYKRFLYCLVYD
jgi:hypothetical protein